jgi:hypothetical protein
MCPVTHSCLQISLADAARSSRAASRCSSHAGLRSSAGGTIAGLLARLQRRKGRAPSSRGSTSNGSETSEQSRSHDAQFLAPHGALHGCFMRPQLTTACPCQGQAEGLVAVAPELCCVSRARACSFVCAGTVVAHMSPTGRLGLSSAINGENICAFEPPFVDTFAQHVGMYLGDTGKYLATAHDETCFIWAVSGASAELHAKLKSHTSPLCKVRCCGREVECFTCLPSRTLGPTCSRLSYEGCAPATRREVCPAGRICSRRGETPDPGCGWYHLLLCHAKLQPAVQYACASAGSTETHAVADESAL